VLHLHVLFESRLAAVAVTAVVAEVGFGVAFEMAEEFVAVGEDLVASVGGRELVDFSGNFRTYLKQRCVLLRLCSFV
jgi:hypothetical protein